MSDEQARGDDAAPAELWRVSVGIHTHMFLDESEAVFYTNCLRRLDMSVSLTRYVRADYGRTSEIQAASKAKEARQ